MCKGVSLNETELNWLTRLTQLVNVVEDGVTLACVQLHLTQTGQGVLHMLQSFFIGVCPES